MRWAMITTKSKMPATPRKKPACSRAGGQIHMWRRSGAASVLFNTSDGDAAIG
jgi:hypothetical protein